MSSPQSSLGVVRDEITSFRGAVRRYNRAALDDQPTGRLINLELVNAEIGLAHQARQLGRALARAQRADLAERFATFAIRAELFSGFPSRIGDEVPALLGALEVFTGEPMTVDITAPVAVSAEPVSVGTSELEPTAVELFDGTSGFGILAGDRRIQFETGERMAFRVLRAMWEPRPMVGGQLDAAELINKLAARSEHPRTWASKNVCHANHRLDLIPDNSFGLRLETRGRGGRTGTDAWIVWKERT
jgi:hypothetical protein